MARTRSFTIDGVTGKAKIDVISEHSEITSVASDDLILLSDTSDSGNIKKATIANSALVGPTGPTGPTGPGGGIQSNSDAQLSSLGVGTGASGTAGEIRATNNITAFYSDERLKTVLGEIDNALEKVKELRGVYFEENETAKSLGYNNDKRQVGVIAQEVEKVLPEVVTKAPIDEKYITVWYDKLVPLLIEAIKELSAKVDKLEGK